MHPTFLLVALLLLNECNARVEFSSAWIYDEYDISANKMVEMHKCLTRACKFYVSAPQSSFASLDNIDCGETTLGAMARSVDPVTGEKVPYFMERYSAKAFMKNHNVNHTCAPVVVYVVREGASMFNYARVFEAKRPLLKVDWQNEETVTLLSAQPFTVTGKINEGYLNGSVSTTGYDNVLGNDDHCPPVYEFTKRNSFKFSVTGPIATLRRESFADVAITVENKFEVIVDSPTLLTSNGYIGCKNGKSYRSSLYSPAVSYHLAYDREYFIHTSAYLNTLRDNVTIQVDGEEAASIKGAVGRLNWNKTLDFHGKELDIRFEGSKPKFSSFLLRFWTSDELVTYQPTSKRFTFGTKPSTGTPVRSAETTTSISPLMQRSTHSTIDIDKMIITTTTKASGINNSLITFVCGLTVRRLQ